MRAQNGVLKATACSINENVSVVHKDRTEKLTRINMLLTVILWSLSVDFQEESAV